MNHYQPDTQALNYIHRTAVLGKNVKVWHYAIILADVEIGDDCSIGSGTEIGAGTKIGRLSRVSAQVFLPSNSVIGEKVFIGPGCIFTDDRWPWAGNSEYKAEPPTIHNGASIGAGSVILPGVTIGRRAMIGAGSVVTKDVPDGAVVRGEPAKLRHMTNFDAYAPVMGEGGELRREDLMDSYIFPK